MIRLFLMASILVATQASAAPSPFGDWSRGDGKANVKIETCDEDICAVNTWIKPGTPGEKVGDKLVLTVKESANGQWAGKAFDPQRHLTYRFTMSVQQQTMTTSGCLLGGLLCKSMNWKRLAD